MTAPAPIPVAAAFEQLTPESYQALLEAYQQMAQENALLKMRLFQRSSERLAQQIGDDTLLPGMADLVDGEPQDVDGPSDLDVAGEAPSRKTKKKGKPHGRAKLPENLTRIVVEHFPDGLTRDEIENDPDLVIVDTEVSEVLGCKPPEYFVTRHLRHKVARRSRPEDGILIAPPAFKPIPKGKADSSVLAQIVTEKYLYHQPLNRQESRFKRMGIHLARSTLCDWILQVSGILAPIHEHMKSELLGSNYLHTDDTPVLLIDPNGGSKKARVWVYAGARTHPYVVYLYSQNRKAEHVESYLKAYKGKVHCDAYSGYDFLFKKESEGKFDCLEIACWSHTRRYIYRADQAGELHAWELLELIGMLFAVERQANELKLEGEKRKAFRNRYSPGILADIREWLDTTGARALPKSLTGKGVTYLNNQWEALKRFLDDGELSLTNNYAERLLRMIAVGRNNWNFFAADSGGKAAVILYSIVQTCLLNDVDPWLYLTDVLNRLETHSAAELLPHNWKTAFEPEARQKYMPVSVSTKETASD